MTMTNEFAPGGDAGGAESTERRGNRRAGVNLSGRWRRHGSVEEPSLVMFFDLSLRGARLAGWNAEVYEPGDLIELSSDDGMSWRAEIVRVLGGGEYGVRFVNPPADVRARLIHTVGTARARREADKWS